MNSTASDTRPGGTALAVLDAESLRRLRELDPDGSVGIFERVLATYLGSLDAQLPLARAAVVGQDAVELRRIAHLLKSSSASLGALRFSALCADVEQHARPGWSAELHSHIEPWLHEAQRVGSAVRSLQLG